MPSSKHSSGWLELQLVSRTMPSFPSASRMHLLSGPTPLEQLHRFSQVLHPNGPRIWIKRDDLTPLVMGGNKVRKLEFLLGEAITQMADTVVTLGAVQSNHACQTAAAARRLGLDPILLLRGDPASPITGNLLLDRMLDATIQIAPEPPDTWGEEVVAELEEAGRRPYLIPYGGSNAVGALGYAAAARELMQQCDEAGVAFETIVVTSSSGGTQAGLMLARAAGWLDAPVLGVSVDRDAGSLADRVHAIAGAAADRYELPAPARSDVQTTDDYVGAGYARMTPATREAILLLAQSEGILTDPVYTGKALSGLIALLRDGYWSRGDDVLFWHTGGVPALFAYTEWLNRT